MAYRTQPEGHIRVSPVQTSDMTNGQMRIIAKATGCKFQDVREMLNWNEHDVVATDDDGDEYLAATGRGRYTGDVDEVDVLWAFGKVALIEAGYEGTDEEADRVVFVIDGEDVTADPTPAA